MAILNPAHELPESPQLNKLIETYNLTNHDDHKERLRLLTLIESEVAKNASPSDPALLKWVNAHHGLIHHMDYHKAEIKPTSSQSIKQKLHDTRLKDDPAPSTPSPKMG